MSADRLARTIALLMFLAACTFMALEVGWLARGLRVDLVPKAQAVVQQASTTLDNSNQALKVEQDHWDAELQETRKATARAVDFIGHVDVMLNGTHFDGSGGILGELHANILPHLDSVVGDTDVAIRSGTRALDRASDDTTLALQGVPPVLQALTARVNDPHWDELLKNADLSMQSIRDTTAHVDASAADLQKVADEWAAPVKGLWNHVKMFLFEAAGPLAEVATAIK